MGRIWKKIKAGDLTAMIARSADFYGPDTKNGAPNVLVFQTFAKGNKASWLVNDRVPHSLTFRIRFAGTPYQEGI